MVSSLFFETNRRHIDSVYTTIMIKIDLDVI